MRKRAAAALMGSLVWWSGVWSWGQGIPEPDLVVYGVVKNTYNNANLRLGHGTLQWWLQPAGGGPPIAVSTTLTNINEQYSYVLRVPCELPVAGYSSSTNRLRLTAAGTTYDRSQVSWNSNALMFVQPSQASTTLTETDRGRIERVDLDVSVPIVIDVNGLPVDWQLMYFGQTGIDPLADPDRDGVDNRSEYLAGTNPNDGASGLRITEIDPGGGVEIRWASAPYKSYAVQRATNLLTGFTDIRVNLTSTPPLNAFLDTNATGLGPYFYRLRLQQP